jgi:hypothetical protein
MKNKIFLFAMILVIIGSVAYAQDLKIDFQLDISGTARSNYLTFTGPIRYMAVEKDHFDGGTGASVALSTEKFQPYRYDVLGKNALSDGFRGLLLFGVAGNDQLKQDNVTIDRASNGTITIQFAHRGTAYKIVTDRSGKINFPDGTFQKRAIGYIVGGGPQVISRDFSRNGTAAGIDWDKVWNAGIAGGKAVDSSSDKKTGNIVNDLADPSSMYYWKGALDTTFSRNVLTISGGLDAVKR